MTHDLRRRGVLLALSALLTCSFAAAAPQPALKAGVFEPPNAAPAFSLQASTGGEQALANYRGKVVLMGFGFTHCPQVCPTTLAVLAQARKRLGAQADRVQVLYVTVDPERDNPDQMRAYLRGFDATFVGLTGTPDKLAAVRAKYGVTAEKKPLGNSYAVAHSSSVYLIDRKGLLRAMMPYGRAPDDYVHDVRILLNE
jgi:protein SCO1/2